jgi:hypothetical protein
VLKSVLMGFSRPLDFGPIFVKGISLFVLSAMRPELLLEPGFVDELINVYPLNELNHDLFIYVVRVTRQDRNEFDRCKIGTQVTEFCDEIMPGEGSERGIGSCRSRLLVWQIQYEILDRTNPEWKERIIFDPGTYIVRLNGQSIWWARGGASRKDGQWSKEIKFDITHSRCAECAPCADSY